MHHVRTRKAQTAREIGACLTAASCFCGAMQELGMAWHLYRARDVVDGVDAVTKAAAHHHSLTLSAAQESTGAQV